LLLVRDIDDDSGLALDPDLDTHHMMNMSVLRGAMQYANTASCAPWANWHWPPRTSTLPGEKA
jgi:hypothetical protein